MSLPFGLNAWFPLIAGDLNDPIVVGENEPLDAQALRTAWDACGPGQALVVVDAIQGSLRAALSGRFGRATMTSRFERIARAEGTVCSWLTLPSTGGSHVLVPASAAGFRAAAPLLPAGRTCWRVARRLLQLAAACGFASRMGLGNLLVAVKGADTRTPNSAWMAGRPAGCVAVSLGVPGLLRKATLRVCDERGHVEGFLKVALGSAANPRVAHEAKTLEHLAGLDLSIAVAPRLLDSDLECDYAWMLQSPLHGVRGSHEIEPEHVQLLTTLAAATGTTRRGEDLPRLERSRVILDELEGMVDEPWLTTMKDLHRVLRDRLRGVDVPCALSHGDFTPWNMSTTANGVAAFDWEFADLEAPALSDLIHFHLQTGILVRRVDARQLQRELADLLAAGAASLVAASGLSAADAMAFVGLEVLRAATEDEALNQKERPPFEQVEWLRETRLDLARRVVRDLLAETSKKREEVVAA